MERGMCSAAEQEGLRSPLLLLGCLVRQVSWHRSLLQFLSVVLHLVLPGQALNVTTLLPFHGVMF